MDCSEQSANSQSAKCVTAKDIFKRLKKNNFLQHQKCPGCPSQISLKILPLSFFTSNLLHNEIKLHTVWVFFPERAEMYFHIEMNLIKYFTDKSR